MAIRFHLDENVDGTVANGLRLCGIDITTTRDAGLIGALDGEHLAFASAENRVIVTLFGEVVPKKRCRDR